MDPTPGAFDPSPEPQTPAAITASASVDDTIRPVDTVPQPATEATIALDEMPEESQVDVAGDDDETEVLAKQLIADAESAETTEAGDSGDFEDAHEDNSAPETVEAESEPTTPDGSHSETDKAFEVEAALPESLADVPVEHVIPETIDSDIYSKEPTPESVDLTETPIEIASATPEEISDLAVPVPAMLAAVPSPVIPSAIPVIDEVNLEDVNLTDDTPPLPPLPVAADATTIDAISTPPPLPARSATKKKPFAWLTRGSVDKGSFEKTDKEGATEQPATLSPEAILAAPPPLPPRRQRKRSSVASTEPASIPENEIAPTTLTPTDVDLLLSRVDANRRDLQTKDQPEQDAHVAGTLKLKQDFEELRKSKSSEDSEDDLASIDWEFWGAFVADYAVTAKTRPLELSHAVQNGLPPPLRGTIWQLMSSSKSLIIEEVFTSLLAETSPHEKGIRRDLSRTSFAKNADQDGLFNVIKAYGLWDPEVGYIQGMAFITVPLILNMKQEEAFGLLVDLMKTYKLRDLFLPEMPGLHLKLYQFDRIMEETIPAVHTHLHRQGVLSSMYASQWFLTFFAYKFPLPIVLRIFDTVVAEGLESILRFGVALMARNEAAIVNLEFDALVTFLKDGLFDAYVEPKAHRTASSIFRGTPNEVTYRVNELVADAFRVKIAPEKLQKYEKEYDEQHRAEVLRLEEMDNLKTQNGKLNLQIKRLEASLATLNAEHIDVANQMIQGKVENEKLKDENTDLATENETLKKNVEELNATIEAMPAKIEQEIEAKLRTEMEDLMKRNLEVMDINRTLEDNLAAVEKEMAETKVKFATINDEHDALTRRWNDIRKVLNE
ncbi:rab-GTPase-TBC domain-containing protein [Limtongia smithiae]|uniref:rab-GTPase-TBC domain-containing protein n=1 Tax=Limtongia smithiae TaxID=1125753 RepID=UPI0034CDD847